MLKTKRRNTVTEQIQLLEEIIYKARVETERLVDDLEEFYKYNKEPHRTYDVDISKLTAAGDSLSKRLNVIKNLIEER